MADDDPTLTSSDGGVSYGTTPIVPEDAIALVEPAGDDPGKDRRLVFLVLAIALFMASIDSTIIASALPKIGSGLHAQLNWTSWTITIFQLGALVALPVGGKIADQFGRRQIFLAALTIFTVSSLLCGLSTSIYMLIPLRLVQALGAGSLMPSAIGIAAESFGRNRDRAIGMFTSVYPFGGLIGSAIGGPIAVYFGWRAIFFINVPIGLGVYVLAVRHLPITPRRDSNPLDVFGVALLALTIVAGMIAITLMGEANASVLNPGFVAALACALGFGHQFWRHEKRTPTPFIPLRLIVGEGFARLNIINVLYGSVLIGFGSLIPLYAHQRYGIGLSAAGSVLSARAIGAVVVAAASTMMLRRTGVRLPMIVGFALVLVGGVALGIAPRGMAPYWWLALFAGVTGLGMGMATPASNNASLHLAPDAIAAISGIRGMFRQIGGITYVSIVTTILARSANNAAAGIAQAHAFWVEGGVLIVLIVLVLRVPDHKGTW